MRFAGDISYGVFLYHLVILDGVMNLLDNGLFSGKVLQVLPLTLVGSVRSPRSASASWSVR